MGPFARRGGTLSTSSRVVALATIIAVGSCSADEGPSLGSPAGESLDASVTAGAGSSATVVIGAQSFTVPVDCYGSAGDIVIVGEGETSSGDPVALRIESSVVESYVGLQVGGEAPATYEPALDQPLDLFVVDDGIEGGAIFFVRDLDVTTGVGSDAGVGSVDVRCVEYLRDLPR